MSVFSDEGRSFIVRVKQIDDTRYVEVAVMEKSGRIVTRDHLPIGEARRLAAELVVAVEA